MILLTLDKDLCNLYIGQIMRISDENNLTHWTNEQYLIDLKDKWRYSVFLKDDDDIVVAYSISTAIHSGYVHIHRLCVGVHYQGNGYGDKILKEIKNQALKEKKDVSLYVRKKNTNAINFYKRFGFKVYKEEDKQLKMVFKINRKNMSIKDNHQLLDMLINDQKEQQGLYRPGPYWNDYSLRIIKALKKQGLKSFRSNARIGKGFSDSLVLEPVDLSNLVSFKSRIYERLVNNYFISKYFLPPYRSRIKSISDQKIMYMDKYYNLKIGEWYKDFKKRNKLPDPCLENPTDVINLCGDSIGRTYLNSYIRIYNYSHSVDFKVKNSLLEIGGGFGANVHALISMYPNIKKVVYLDIPPMLYIATQYLESIYKEAVKDYSDTRNSNAINFKNDNSLEIICVAPWQIEKLDLNIDLFWNSASFQEMTADTVKNYCKNLERIMNDKTSVCSYVYNTINNETTIGQDKLKRMISDALSKPFHEVEQRIEINKGKYFLWQGDHCNL